MAPFRRDGPIVVKGVQRVDDAVEVGPPGGTGWRSRITVDDSSTGPRLRSRCCRPFVDSVGDRAEVYIDGGVRSGADVAAAVAFGARAAFVGRPYLYALMAGGERGVDHLATLLREDDARNLRLLGVSRTADLHRGLRLVVCGVLDPGTAELRGPRGHTEPRFASPRGGRATLALTLTAPSRASGWMGAAGIEPATLACEGLQGRNRRERNGSVTPFRYRFTGHAARRCSPKLRSGSTTLRRRSRP